MSLFYKLYYIDSNRLQNNSWLSQDRFTLRLHVGEVTQGSAWVDNGKELFKGEQTTGAPSANPANRH